LWIKGLNAKDINKETFPVRGGKCLSRKADHNWIEKFPQGRSKVTDDARPGFPVEITTEETVQLVEELIQADRRITIDSLATAVGCSHGLTYSTMHDRSKFRKMCAQWVPREQKYRKKTNRVGLSLQHLAVYR
jgi:transposase